jgi:hypothetical protein
MFEAFARDADLAAAMRLLDRMVRDRAVADSAMCLVGRLPRERAGGRHRPARRPGSRPTGWE